MHCQKDASISQQLCQQSVLGCQFLEVASQRTAHEFLHRGSECNIDPASPLLSSILYHIHDKPHTSSAVLPDLFQNLWIQFLLLKGIGVSISSQLLTLAHHYMGLLMVFEIITIKRSKNVPPPPVNSTFRPSLRHFLFMFLFVHRYHIEFEIYYGKTINI